MNVVEMDIVQDIHTLLQLSLFLADNPENKKDDFFKGMIFFG